MDKYITRTPNNNSQRLVKGPANHTLMVIQLNCGPGGLISVQKKLELNKFLYDIQPDIVLLQFPGYSMINRNRLPTYKTTGGGVAILIRESARITNNRSYCSRRSMHWPSTGRDLTVTSLYNPPVSSRPWNRQGFSAEYTLSACARHGTSHIIGGDFNAHSKTWDSAEDVVESEEGAQIEEWLRENDATLSNTGDSTLRHSSTARWAAIDLSIHMGEAFISDWRTIPALGFSDHVTLLG